MALVKCPECGKEVSDQSKNCIHCGYPLFSNQGIKEDYRKNQTTWDKTASAPRWADEMKRCPVCGAPISKSATVCPKCGRQDPNNHKIKQAIILGILSLACLAYVFFSTQFG